MKGMFSCPMPCVYLWHFDFRSPSVAAGEDALKLYALRRGWDRALQVKWPAPSIKKVERGGWPLSMAETAAALQSHQGMTTRVRRLDCEVSRLTGVILRRRSAIISIAWRIALVRRRVCPQNEKPSGRDRTCQANIAFRECLLSAPQPAGWGSQ